MNWISTFSVKRGQQQRQAPEVAFPLGLGPLESAPRVRRLCHYREVAFLLGLGPLGSAPQEVNLLKFLCQNKLQE